MVSVSKWNWNYCTFVKGPTTSGPFRAQLKSCIVETKGGGIVVSVSKWNWNYCTCMMSLHCMCVTFYIMLCVFKCAYSCHRIVRCSHYNTVYQLTAL